MPAPGRSSLIDSVDEYDRPAGVIERGRVFDVLANFRVVHIFVFRPNGELLLQRLGFGRERHPGLWGSSVAGYLHHGESYEGAARRRLEEELRLDTPLAKRGETWLIDRGCKKFIHLYETTASSPKIGEPEHIDALEWRPLSVIESEMRSRPDSFTETFRHLFTLYLTDASVGI